MMRSLIASLVLWTFCDPASAQRSGQPSTPPSAFVSPPVGARPAPASGTISGGSGPISDAAFLEVESARQRLVQSIDRTRQQLQRASAVNLGAVAVTDIDSRFVDLRSDVQGVLDQLDANGTLADQIGAAQMAAQRAHSFWSRQEGDPDRESQMQLLDGNIRSYEGSRLKIQEVRELASRQLTLIIDRQMRVQRLTRTQQIDEAARQLQSMVESMGELTTALSNLPNNVSRGGAAN